MTIERIPPTEEKINSLLSDFEKKYHVILDQLHSLSEGTFDEFDGPNMAAFCLVSLAALTNSLKDVAYRSRVLKQNSKIAESEAYGRIKESKSKDGSKVTETTVAHLVALDKTFNDLTRDYIRAETDLKQLENIKSILDEAHITFRSLKKGI